MLKPVYTLIITCLLLNVVACNRHENDRSATTGSDSLQIEKLITTGLKYTSSNTDSVLLVAKQLRALSKKHDNKTGLVYAQLFEVAYYWATANYQQAMPLALNTLTNAEQWNIREPIPQIYSAIANMHKENGNYNAAFKDAEEGLAAAWHNHDTANVISLLGLKAMFTHGYFRKHGRQQDDHTSLALQFEGLKLAESQPKYERSRIKFYNNIAQTYKEQKDYAKALSYSNKAIELALKYKQLRSLTYSYNWLGETYYYMGQQAKGIDYLNKAIIISRQLKLPYREMELYEAMHNCYMSSKNYQAAIKNLDRFTQMRDSLQVAKNEKQITELQLKYESVKKDKQIASLDAMNVNKNSKILWISTGMLFFIILVVVILRQYFIIHRYSRMVEANNQKLNNALLKIAYIQSHQIRKPLASIMGLMNIIKSHDYEPDKEVLQKMDVASQELDQRIRDVIVQTEIVD
jgi:tetratricopeptide (TPR) repeat protein